MARLPIIMPKMSMTMTEGEVAGWLVKVGDVIAEGDVVAEVMTDKVDMEVESTVSGTLTEIAVESGTVAVGDPIGWVEGEGSALGDLFADEEPAPPAAPSRAEDTEPVADAAAQPVAVDAPPARETGAPVRPPARSAGPVAAVPRARGLARERGVDLASLTGTGPDGLVTVADVERASGAVVQPPAPAPAAVAVLPAAGVAGEPVRTGRAAAVRRVVAGKMSESAAVPQFTLWRDLDLTAANAARRVSWTTVLLQAYAAALRQVPLLLARFEGDQAVHSGPPAVALAVDTPAGLLVPVFAEPDLADPAELDAEVKAVVAAATQGRVDQAYLGVANGSLSNLGGMGVDRFQALVTPPQASVLALGSIRQRPVAVPGGVGLALTLTAGLTVDHRVADGADGARLLDAVATTLSA